jgi:hypothetical protein
MGDAPDRQRTLAAGLAPRQQEQHAHHEGDGDRHQKERREIEAHRVFGTGPIGPLRRLPFIVVALEMVRERL